MTQDTFFIKKIAVLGAGVMGAQIAAQCVNAGFQTFLFDLATPEGSPNALIDKAIAHLKKLKPAPLGSSQTTSFLQAKNYEDNLSDLVECDLIIEAIGERLDWKTSLYQRIAPFVHPQALVVSNTSGLSINTLAACLPEILRKRFCGVHFFNPPRYMHLAELIPANDTSHFLLDFLESWLTSCMGKGVVRAKDTPNFIANRIGVFSLLTSLHYAQLMQIGLDEVDALTGPLIGRPKSATCRTMDVVGLDTMQHVVHTMHEQLKTDPWHSLFQLPLWLDECIKKGHFGQKTGQGIFRKQGKSIEVLDIASGQYRIANAVVSDELKGIFRIADPAEKMKKLFASQHKQAKFLTACYLDLFHYCAYHLEAIADTTRDVDLAIRWGFGWEKGPFESWQQANIETIGKAILARHSEKALLPDWFHKDTIFYTEKGAFSPAASAFIPRSNLPVYKRQFFPDRMVAEQAPSLKILFENKGVRLRSFEDGIGLLSFKSKANSIGQEVLDGLQESLSQAERQCKGLIIHQEDANNFSAGADLRAVLEHLQSGNLKTVDTMIAHFQQLMMRIKYSPIPIVAALRGRALGGGCELILHCDAVVAAYESSPGLVEIGVGLLPAGGGCKEMALRAAYRAGENDVMIFLQDYFQQIAKAEVASSAEDALLRGYLKSQDCWLMHIDEVLYAALAKIRSMLASNYTPPRASLFKVAGREGRAKLQAGLLNWLEGGFISEYDYYLAKEIAQVICGGDVNQGTLVDEAWILNLERQSFIALAANPLTQARIAHLLETGKPLRN